MGKSTKLLIFNIFVIAAVIWALVNFVGAPDLELLVILSIVIVLSGVGNVLIMRYKK